MGTTTWISSSIVSNSREWLKTSILAQKYHKKKHFNNGKLRCHLFINEPYNTIIQRTKHKQIHHLRCKLQLYWEVAFLNKGTRSLFSNLCVWKAHLDTKERAYGDFTCGFLIFPQLLMLLVSFKYNVHLTFTNLHAREDLSSLLDKFGDLNRYKRTINESI